MSWNRTGQIFYNKNLDGQSFVGHCLRDTKFINCSMISCDFTVADICNANFEGSNLTNSKLNGTDWSQAYLKGIVFDGCDFSSTRKKRSKFGDNLQQVRSMRNCNFKDADFSDCSFEYLMINPVSYPEAVRHILEEEHVRRGIRTDDWDMISDWFRVNSSRGLNEKPNAIINCSISDFMKPSRKNIRFKGGEDTIEYKTMDGLKELMESLILPGKYTRSVPGKNPIDVYKYKNSEYIHDRIKALTHVPTLYDFTGSSFENVHLGGRGIEHCCFDRVDFTNTNLTSTIFKSCKMRHTKLNRSKWQGVKCFNCDLSYSNMQGLIVAIPFTGDNKNNMTGVDLSNGSISRNVILSGGNYEGMQLRKICLELRDMTNTSFDNCDFRDSKIINCNVNGSSFKNAILRNVEVEQTDFSNADLSGAVLDNINTKYFKNAEGENIDILNTKLTSVLKGGNNTYHTCKLNKKVSYVGTNWSNNDISGMVFKDMDLSNCVFINTVLDNCIIRNCFGSNVIFQNCSVTNTVFFNNRFMKSTFMNINFEILWKLRLKKSIMSECTFPIKTNIMLLNVRVVSCDFSKKSLGAVESKAVVTLNSKTTFNKCKFKASTFLKNVWDNVYWTHCNFSHAKFNECSFDGGSMTYSNFQHASMSGITLKGINICHSNFIKATLADSIFTGVRAEYSHFDFLDLRTLKIKLCDFTHSSFIGSNMSGLNMKDNRFDNASFVEANLNNVTLESLPKDINLKGTRMNSSLLKGGIQNKRSFTSTDFTGKNWENFDMKGKNFTNSAFPKNLIVRNRNLKNTIFDGVLFRNCSFVDCNLEGCSFVGIRVEDTILDLSGSNLKNAKLNGIDTSYIQLNDCNLAGAIFDRATMNNFDFSGKDLTDCSFVRTSLINCKWNNVFMSGTTFKHANLGGSKGKNIKMDGCNFKECRMKGIKFENVSSVKSIFKRIVGTNGTWIKWFALKCDMRHAQLENCSITYCTFDGSNFIRTNINNSEFKNNKMKNTKCHQFYFENAKDLRGTDFSYVNMERRNLNINLTDCVFDHCLFDYTRISKATLKNTSFACATFRNMDIPKYTSVFEKSTFENVQFLNIDEARFDDCMIITCTLPQKWRKVSLRMTKMVDCVIPTQSQFSDCVFEKCHMNYIQLDKAKLINCSFYHAHMTHASMNEINGKNVVFDYANMEYASFMQSNLIKSSFKSTNIRRSVFEKCKLLECQFNRTRVLACNFDGANLHKCEFYYANLSNSIFNQAKMTSIVGNNVNMTGCHFRRTDFKNTTITNAMMYGSDFRSSKNKQNITGIVNLQTKGF